MKRQTAFFWGALIGLKLLCGCSWLKPPDQGSPGAGSQIAPISNWSSGLEDTDRGANKDQRDRRD
jgi:hypothetical protein